MTEAVGPFAHPPDDRWIDLARGLLDPQSRLTALAHLRACSACESRFREVCREAELLDLGPLPSVLRAPRRWTRRRALWIATAAAAALLLVALFRLAGPGDSAELDYRLPVQSEPLLLRSLPDAEGTASLLAAVEAYRHDDFRHVLRLLEGRALDGELDFLNLFYASALVWTGRPRDAESVLNRLSIDTLPHPYRDRARRVLYVALRREGRDTDAEELVRRLAAGSGEFTEWARRELTRAPERRSR